MGEKFTMLKKNEKGDVVMPLGKRTGFILCVLILFLVSVLPVYADGSFWNCGLDGFPKCEGQFNGSTVGSKVVTQATVVRWTAAHKAQVESGASFEMETEDSCWWNGSPVNMNYGWSSVPNQGWDHHTHCGEATGENELLLNAATINSAGGSGNETPQYFFGIQWNCLIAGSHNIKVEFKKGPGGPNMIGRATPNCTSGSRSSEGLVDTSSAQLSIDEQIETVTLWSSSIHGYKYVVQQVGDEYEVKVIVEFDDSNLDTFTVANVEFQDLLNSRASDDEIMVTVTFKRPNSYQDVTEFISNVGMVATQYAVYGTSNENDLIFSSYYPSSDGQIEEFPASNTYNENVITNDGVMMVTGIVSHENLDIINSQDNIALLDVSANVIRDEIAQQLGINIEASDIYIPNPAWLAYEDSLANPTAVGLSSTLANWTLSGTAIISLAIILTLSLITASQRKVKYE